MAEIRTTSVVASDGVRIAVDIYRAQAPARVIILAPGFWRRRASKVMKRLALYFSEKNCATAVFDFRGHGDSEGSYAFGSEEPKDLSAVMEEVFKIYPQTPINILGFSLGGSIAIMTLAKYPHLKERIKSLITVGAPSDFSKIKISVLKTPKAIPHLSLYEAVRPPRISLKAYLSPKPCFKDSLKNLSPTPLYIFHTQNDWLVDVRHAYELYDTAQEPKHLHIFPFKDSLHADALIMTHFEEFIKAVEEALERE